MLRYSSYDIVFQEIPGEVTLAVNLSGCPNRCPGCHSPWLQEDGGEALDDVSLSRLLEQYGNAVTCLCFMGGDANPTAVEQLAQRVRQQTQGVLKTAWYSGRVELPASLSLQSFDFIKTGPYIEKLGGLDCPTTNQRFYRIEGEQLIDNTHLFRRTHPVGEQLVIT